MKKSPDTVTVNWAKYRLTEEKTVVLNRPDLNTGLGVTLAKYPHDVPHPRIFELAKDGVAAQSARLKAKDVIVAVNGVSVNSDAAVAQVIQLTGLQITFTIRRAPSPRSAHQMCRPEGVSPVQNKETNLNSAPDASAEVAWTEEPEQPAYPLQVALASPPESPAPFAFNSRSLPTKTDEYARRPDRPYSPGGSSVSSTEPSPYVKAGLPPRQAPPGPPPVVPLVDSPDGERGAASPKSDGTETSAESEAEAGLNGEPATVDSTKDDFWGACLPLTTDSWPDSTRVCLHSAFVPAHTDWLNNVVREISKPFALCTAPRRKDHFAPNPFRLWPSPPALTEITVHAAVVTVSP